jgi:hypothetical protein
VGAKKQFDACFNLHIISTTHGCPNALHPINAKLIYAKFIYQRRSLMRDDPYPARFYGRQVDEPFMSDMLATLPHDGQTSALQRPLQRLVLLLLTLYLGCAIFLLLTVTSYAAPLGSATIFSPAQVACVESATVAAR